MLHTKYTRLHQIQIIGSSVATVTIGVLSMLLMVMYFA